MSIYLQNKQATDIFFLFVIGIWKVKALVDTAFFWAVKKDSSGFQVHDHTAERILETRSHRPKRITLGIRDELVSPKLIR